MGKNPLVFLKVEVTKNRGLVCSQSLVPVFLALEDSPYYRVDKWRVGQIKF